MNQPNRFTVDQHESRDAFGNYCYPIYKDGVLFATYWHDFRGDESGIRFEGTGRNEYLPWSASEFVGGDGSGSLWLTQTALTYLRKQL